MKKALLASLTVSSVVLAANSALGATVTIDDFQQSFIPNDPLVTYDIDLSSTKSATGAGIIGGTRGATLQIITTPIDPNDSGSVGDTTLVTTGGGALDQSVSGNVGNFTTTTLTWNGAGSGLGANLKPSATFDRFRTKLNLFDLFDNSTTTAIGTIALRVSNSVGGSYSTWTQTLNKVSSAQTLDFLYSDFSQPSVFDNPINEIQLEITGLKAGLLFNLGGPTSGLVAFGSDLPPGSVPEPSLAIGCLALAGVATWKKVRESSKKS